MDKEGTTTVQSAEVWAVAQVEAVAQHLEKREKRTRRGAVKTRGVYFVWRTGGEVVGPKHACAERGCEKAKCNLDGETRGEWWVLWYDADSRRHREKAGCGYRPIMITQITPS